MSITTTSSLPAPVQQSFSYKLLSVPVPNMIHKIPAMLKQMPKNAGHLKSSLIDLETVMKLSSATRGKRKQPERLNEKTRKGCDSLNTKGNFVRECRRTSPPKKVIKVTELRNGGTTLRMRRYNPLSVAMVPLGRMIAQYKFSLIDLETVVAFS